MSADTSRAKNWCFTINNPTADEKAALSAGLPAGVDYLVFQLERGAEGTPHYQGFVQFHDRKRLSQVKSLSCRSSAGVVVAVFARAHLEVARGKVDDNYAYCTKPESRVAGPFEFGSPLRQGDRIDLKESADLLMSTGKISSVDPQVVLKYGSNCFKVLALTQAPRRDELLVITMIGSTGIGKSWSVYDIFPTASIAKCLFGNSGCWFDGYTDQDILLFEEFKGQIPLQKMLTMLDPYPLKLEVKGGATNAFFKVAIILSNSPPSEWYPDDPAKPQRTRGPERDALYRRLGCGPFASPRFIEIDGSLVNDAGRRALHLKLRTLFSLVRCPVPWSPTSTILADLAVVPPAAPDSPAAPAIAPLPPPSSSAASSAPPPALSDSDMEYFPPPDPLGASWSAPIDLDDEEARWPDDSLDSQPPLKRTDKSYL